jgi:hypothetical protein
MLSEWNFRSCRSRGAELRLQIGHVAVPKLASEGSSARTTNVCWHSADTVIAVASPTSQPFEVQYGLLAIRAGDPNQGTAVTFDVFRMFHHSTYKRYEDAYSRVADARDGDLSVYAVSALNQIDGMVRQIETLVTTSSVPAVTASAGEWSRTVAGAVLTLCSSVHLFQEQTEAAVARHFGSDSAEHVRIQERFAAAYDSSFEYRLMYRLRNVLVHHSMKSVGLRFKARLEQDPDGTERKVAHIELPLVRRTFLGTRKGVSAAIRREPEGLDSEPDVRDLGASAIAAIHALRQDSMDLVHPRLGPDCEVLIELSQQFPPWSEADRALVQVTVENGVPQFPHVSLRREVLDYAEAQNQPSS